MAFRGRRSVWWCGVSVIVAGTAFGEFLEIQSAKCCVFPYKMPVVSTARILTSAKGQLAVCRFHARIMVEASFYWRQHLTDFAFKSWTCIFWGSLAELVHFQILDFYCWCVWRGKHNEFVTCHMLKILLASTNAFNLLMNHLTLLDFAATCGAGIFCGIRRPSHRHITHWTTRDGVRLVLCEGCFGSTRSPLPHCWSIVPRNKTLIHCMFIYII